MTLGPMAKVVLGAAGVIALAAYLVVVDVGVGAGRIHHGVHLDGLDLGGMTEAEAVPHVEELGRRVRESPIVFSTQGFDCRFYPRRLGWGPQPFDTVREAMAVGRAGGLLRGLGDRVKAWLGGVEVAWAGRPNPAKVTEWLDDCVALGEGFGVTVDRARLATEVGVAIETWPRDQVWDLPRR